MPVSCHFRVCKAPLSSIVSGARRAEKMQYKTEKDTTDTYKDKRNIQIQKYFKQPYRPITIMWTIYIIFTYNIINIPCDVITDGNRDRMLWQNFKEVVLEIKR